MTDSATDVDGSQPVPPASKGQSLGSQAVGLWLGGWFPALAVGAGVCLPTLSNENPMLPAMAFGLFVPINASLVYMLIAPWLGPWRRSVKGSAVAYLALSTLFSLGLVLWTLASLTALPIFGPRVLGVPSNGTGGLADILPALDMILGALPAWAWAAGWGAGMLACLVFWAFCRPRPVFYMGEVVWRKVVGGLLALPWALVLLVALSTVVRGARVDSDFLAAYGSDISKTLETRKGNPQAFERVRDNLPTSFKEVPAVRKWLNGHDAAGGPKPDKADQKIILDAWRREVNARWGSADFPQGAELQALAKLATLGSLVDGVGIPPEQKAEIAVRAQVILLDSGGVSYTLSQHLYDTKLPASGWTTLQALALRRDDILRGASMSEDGLRDSFVAQGVKVLYKSDHDLDGNLQRDFFHRCIERAQLNRRWRNYEKGRPYPDAARPLTASEFKARYAPSLGFHLDAIDDDVTQVPFDNEIARQDLAYNIVLMELKNLEAAAKSKLPSSWGDFRPQIGAIGKAYFDWIRLSKIPGGVRLQRQDPRYGPGLPHDFKSRG